VTWENIRIFTSKCAFCNSLYLNLKLPNREYSKELVLLHLINSDGL